MPTFPIKALAYQNLPILPKNYQTTTKLEPYYPIIVSFTYIIIIYFDSVFVFSFKTNFNSSQYYSNSYSIVVNLPVNLRRMIFTPMLKIQW